jgi:two-component system cell cycle sensor histidine kinase/response regulator CckA
MDKNKTYLDDFSEFHSQAEPHLQKSQLTNMNLPSSPEEMLRLIHELSVHQIELEMQQQELRQSRQKLEKSLERYTDLYDFAPLGYLTLAPDSKIVEVNLTATKMLDIERSRLRGKRLEHFIAAKDLQTFKALLKRVFNRKEPNYCEATLSRPGTTTTSQKIFRIEAVVNDNGKACRAILTDISRQKKIEQAMHASNERQQLFIDATHSGSWEWDLLTNSIIWSNELWCLFGLDPHSCEASYDTWLQSIVPDDRKKTEQIVLNAMERGKGFAVEWRVHNNSGRERWIMSKGTPFKGDDGQVQRYVGIVIDISELKTAQEVGKKEQAFSKTIIDSINGTFYMIDAGGYYAGWNSFLRDEIVGKTESEMADTLAISTMHPEDRALLHEKIVNVLEHGLEENLEARVLVHGGPEFRWFLMTVRRIIIDGHPVLIGIGIDITERKKIEDVQLFLSNSSYASSKKPFFKALARYIAENLDMNFVCIDSLDGDGLTVRTLAVWSEGHFEDNVVYTLNDKPFVDEVGKEVCCFPANMLCQLFPHNQVLHDLREESYVGETLWDHAGQPIGFIFAIGHRPLENRKFAETALKMVSVRAAGELERLQSERALQASEKNYRELFDSVPIGLYKLTMDGKVIAANQRCLDIIRCKISDLESWFAQKTPASCVYPEESMQFRDLLLKQGYLSNFEADFSLMDGRVATLSNTAKIVFNEQDEPVFIAGSFIDVTEHKQNQKEKAKLEVQLQQSQKMEMIGRLAGGIAHDFNNMLTIILGHSEMAVELFDPSQAVYANLEAIQQAAIRSASLTQQLLAFARKQIVTPKILELSVALEEMLPMLRRLIGEHIKLVWIPDCKNSQVNIDPSQIDQILVNLCVNARDAISGNGSITLESGNQAFSDIATETADTNDPSVDYVTFSVRDDGCGINQFDLEHIFEPFFTTKESGKGTGLGLSTVYGIVKQNNGTIECQSKPGKGTIFTIRLPHYNVQSEADQETPLDVSIHYGHHTILLVEDEPNILSLCKIMLEHNGYKVLIAASAAEAIKIAENYNGTIDLLVTDVIMPEMNGAELSKILLSDRPELKTLFMSGYTADIIAHNSVLESGVNFIQKPVTMKSLTRIVYTILNSDKTE